MKLVLSLLVTLWLLCATTFADIRSPRNLYITNLLKAIHLENTFEVQVCFIYYLYFIDYNKLNNEKKTHFFLNINTKKSLFMLFFI